MGDECTEFIYKEFPDDEELTIAALGVKLTGLSTLGIPSSQEYAQICDEVLSAIEKYESTTQVQVLPSFILAAKCSSLMCKGGTLLENDPTNAIEHFEKAKEIILQEMDSSNQPLAIMMVTNEIINAKAKLPGVDEYAALENLSQKKKLLLAEYKDKFGEGEQYILELGKDLSCDLIKLERFEEAKNLLMSLHHSSHQVHGRDHPYTKIFEEMLMISDAMSNNSAS
jgi:hypothetical protein